jgi:TPP-dependent 2-oxoacid decarboxylase
MDTLTFVILSPPPQSDHEQNRLSLITSLCKKLGVEVIPGYTKKGSGNKLQYKTISAEIKQADGVIIEASRPTLDIGRFIATALQYHKPVLILYQGELPDVLADDTHTLVTIKEYEEPKHDHLEQKILSSFLTKVEKKKLLYRFNLMLSKEMNMYLMDKAKTKGVSKADYIRTLITDDMT